ncbi:galactose-1-epimerase [Vibrio sp. ZSDE26]|uniref:Aldose 1-epimerase n=1 Tax=Vibrio amylolyticus TaxID=2847292 RepID=A0A9X1XKB7_9VIBR|nr:galactose-1-epimerase [Vibrio amylolyticus]MCK6262495.1 galactose-1-epimerase [Vibrio amylolyticus]
MTQSLLTTMKKAVAYDGHPANLAELTNRNGFSIVVMDIGATWLSCQVPVHGEPSREVILGVSTMEDFQKHGTYLGATVGRYANRIANGQFEIDGQSYQVNTNQAGNCLHGGENGFDKRRWAIVEQSERCVVMRLHSVDGDQGFPGNLSVLVTYQLNDENQVSINYRATTDKATPVNLTNHSYFNLLGAESGEDCKQHAVQILADQYLPTTDTGIPLDKPVSVSDTSFDFRQPKTIAQDLFKGEQQVSAKGYDHSFVFNSKSQGVALVASVISPDEKIQLDVWTDKPAMQLYSGNYLAGTPNRRGGEYEDYAGLALETQFLPDAPNHPEWEHPSSILHPEQEYLSTTCYQFKALG